jgi:TPR repeat protein
VSADEVEGSTAVEETQQWPPQEAEGESETEGGVKLRVTGLPYINGFVYGDVNITRDGTVVADEDEAQKILEAAAKAGVPLEVVSE